MYDYLIVSVVAISANSCNNQKVREEEEGAGRSLGCILLLGCLESFFGVDV